MTVLLLYFQKSQLTFLEMHFLRRSPLKLDNRTFGMYNYSDTKNKTGNSYSRTVRQRRVLTLWGIINELYKNYKRQY